MPFYRVLKGRHVEGVDESGVPKRYYKGGPHGEVIETDKDLEKLNDPRDPKFERLSDTYEPSLEPEPIAQSTDSVLDEMSKEELIEFAEAEEIEIDKRKNKENILEQIKAAMV